jgi:hypothetical protein
VPTRRCDHQAKSLPHTKPVFVNDGNHCKALFYFVSFIVTFYRDFDVTKTKITEMFLFKKKAATTNILKKSNVNQRRLWSDKIKKEKEGDGLLRTGQYIGQAP